MKQYQNAHEWQTEDSDKPLTRFYGCLYDEGGRLVDFVNDPWRYVMGDPDDESTGVGPCTAQLETTGASVLTTLQLKRLVLSMDAARIREALVGEENPPEASKIASWVLLKEIPA